MYFKGLFNTVCYRRVGVIPPADCKCIGVECSRYPVCYIERETAIKQIDTLYPGQVKI